jgi:hypothetical protein
MAASYSCWFYVEEIILIIVKATYCRAQWRHAEKRKQTHKHFGVAPGYFAMRKNK